MAAKKSWKAPEAVVGVLTKTCKVQISKAKLAKFLKQVKKKREEPTVYFCAKNAPFMRRPPIPPV